MAKKKKKRKPAFKPAETDPNANALFTAWLALTIEKFKLEMAGVEPADVEYEPSVVKIRAIFHDKCYLCHDAKLDPTGLIVRWTAAMYQRIKNKYGVDKIARMRARARR